MLDAERDKSKKLLIELLNIPSVNSKDDEGAVARFLLEYFKQHGIEATYHGIDARRGNVLAKLEGHDSKRAILWNGHLDTVDYGELTAWHSKPWEAFLKYGKLYGRGASDMKSGLAAMVHTLCELSQNGIKPAHDIYFLGTADEEKSGIGALHSLERYYFPKLDEVLIGEPSSLKIGIAQKGCIWMKLQFRGKTSHGAYPERGINAIEEGYSFVGKLKSYIEAFTHELLGSSSCQINIINGGIVPNMTADSCEMIMDIRVVPGLSLDMIEAKIEELSSSSPVRVKTELLNHRMSVNIDKEDSFVKELEKAYNTATGEACAYLGINYFTDASIFLQKYPNLKIMSFGAGDEELCHQPDEYVELESYYKSIEVLKAYAKGEC